MALVTNGERYGFAMSGCNLTATVTLLSPPRATMKLHPVGAMPSHSSASSLRYRNGHGGNRRAHASSQRSALKNETKVKPLDLPIYHQYGK